ncbi:MAG: hypothetical protein M1829_003227 [Trizodia sp. TS-e1964]|nr:MAG: hypothetical protein M1829_003227 [Trizodia sp. TS-e1964]
MNQSGNSFAGAPWAYQPSSNQSPSAILTPTSSPSISTPPSPRSGPTLSSLSFTNNAPYSLYGGAGGPGQQSTAGPAEAGAIPNILRASSPIVERGRNPFQALPNNLGNSNPQPSPLSLYQRSMTTPVPAPEEHYQHPRAHSIANPYSPASSAAYQIPPAPAPPLPLPSYGKTNGDTHRSSVILSPTSSTGSTSDARTGLLSRWMSNRFQTTSHHTPIRSNTGRFEALREEDEAYKTPSSNFTSQHSGYAGVFNIEDSEELGYDISTLSGPIGFRDLSDPSGHTQTKLCEDYQHQNGLAAEFHQLEAEGKLTGGLGGGMIGATIGFKGAHSTAQASDGTKIVGNGEGGLSRGLTIRGVGQREAKERNEIVTVTEPGVDLSSFGGNTTGVGDVEPDIDMLSLRSMTTNKLSYYFPPDPEKPNWKPLSMRWPYISFLVTISLAFAGIEEYMYQVSARLRSQNEGLLSFVKPGDLGTWDWFCWKYLPTILAVTYGVLWQIVDFEVKRLEPYYQLSKPSGALAEESLNLDYLTFWSILTPFKALRCRQWAVVASSIGTFLAVSLVPTFQAASVIVLPEINDRKADQPKFVHLHPVWSRVLTATLGLISILGICLLFELRRKSGLLSNPNGIAGIAAMANKSHILMDFKDLDTANPDAIHQRLKHRRYILHKSTLWQGEYIRNTNKHENTHRRVKNPHPLMLRLKAGFPFMLFILIVMAIIPILLFDDNANNVTQTVPWLLTAFAVAIKLMWSALECNVRMMEPFYILSNRNAPSETLTMDYSATIPGVLMIRAFLGGQILLSLVGFGSILGEVLTVCVSSISGVKGTVFFPASLGQTDRQDRPNTDQTFKSFWVSFSLAEGILLFLCTLAAVVYMRRRHPFLPRLAGSIASVLAFIHQSKMLYDFVGTEKLNANQMTQHLKKKNKTYGLGWFKGRDGEDHCGVDEEPLLSKYKHGSRFQDARAPWLGNWGVY